MVCNELKFMLPLVILLVYGQSENSTFRVSIGPKLEISFFPDFATSRRDKLREREIREFYKERGRPLREL